MKNKFGSSASIRNPYFGDIGLEKEDFVQFIKDSHSTHTNEYCEKELNIGSCAIYDSIQGNDNDDELIAVALDIDDSIIESFVSYSRWNESWDVSRNISQFPTRH